jgi:hypothetical protein
MFLGVIIMSNDDKTIEDVLAEDALNELLSLSGKGKKTTPKSARSKKPTPIATKPSQQPRRVQSKPTGLAAIIQNAKTQGQVINAEMWNDPDAAQEKELQKKLKKMNKSEYDSDILRQRILKRQAEKRGYENPLSALVSNMKKPTGDE